MTPYDFRRRWEGYVPPELRDSFLLELAVLLTLEQSDARASGASAASPVSGAIDPAGVRPLAHAA